MPGEPSALSLLLEPLRSLIWKRQGRNCFSKSAMLSVTELLSSARMMNDPVGRPSLFSISRQSAGLFVRGFLQNTTPKPSGESCKPSSFALSIQYCAVSPSGLEPYPLRDRSRSRQLSGIVPQIARCLDCKSLTHC